MDMQVSFKTRKSRFYNEDRYIISDNLFMVLDGATPLCKTNIKPSSASWFVSFVKKNIVSEKGGINQRLEKISQKAFEWLNTHGLFEQDFLPSAGMAWAQIDGESIVVNTIGDCEATVVKRDDSVERVVQKELFALDGFAINEMVRISNELGISLVKAKEQIKPLLIKHRQMMNKPDGYNVFAPDSVGKFCFLTKTFALHDVKEIYLYTDGYADAFDALGIYPSHEMAFKHSPDVNKEVDKIVKASFDDADCTKYPRFKKIDDITIIKLKF